MLEEVTLDGLASHLLVEWQADDCCIAFSAETTDGRGVLT